MSLNCRLCILVYDESLHYLWFFSDSTIKTNNDTQFGRNKADFDHNPIQPCTSTIFILPLNRYGLKVGYGKGIVYQI